MVRFTGVFVIYTVNSKDLFQPQNAKISPEAPGADAARCGTISVSVGTKQSIPISLF